MKFIHLLIPVLLFGSPAAAVGEMLGNPGCQVGEKNLFVGIEYSSAMRVFDLDTKNLDTSSDRITLKVTTGLTDWLDIYVRAGAADMRLDYKGNDYVYKTSGVTQRWGNASKNFASDYGAGFGGGTRVKLLDFVNSRTRVFFQGGGFFYKTDGEIIWNLSDGSVITKNRELKWADIYAGIGVSRRFDYIDFTFGIGFSEVWWEINDENLLKVGNTTTRNRNPKRNSFEIRKPVFGFVGLDFVLPLEYRISLQAGIKNTDEAEFSVALSQGLERD